MLLGNCEIFTCILYIISYIILAIRIGVQDVDDEVICDEVIVHDVEDVLDRSEAITKFRLLSKIRGY